MSFVNTQDLKFAAFSSPREQECLQVAPWDLARSYSSPGGMDLRALPCCQPNGRSPTQLLLVARHRRPVLFSPVCSLTWGNVDWIRRVHNYSLGTALDGMFLPVSVCTSTSRRLAGTWRGFRKQDVEFFLWNVFSVIFTILNSSEKRWTTNEVH